MANCFVFVLLTGRRSKLIGSRVRTIWSDESSGQGLCFLFSLILLIILFMESFGVRFVVPLITPSTFVCVDECLTDSFKHHDEEKKPWPEYYQQSRKSCP
jgi:hypothetical protein